LAMATWHVAPHYANFSLSFSLILLAQTFFSAPSSQTPTFRNRKNQETKVSYLWNNAHSYKLLHKLARVGKCPVIVNLLLPGSPLLWLFVIHCIIRHSDLYTEILVNNTILWHITQYILLIEENIMDHFDFSVHVECFLVHKFVKRKGISIVMDILKFWVIL
jgi:hypothetical protein